MRFLPGRRRGWRHRWPCLPDRRGRAAESADEVAVVRFGPGGLEVVGTVGVGSRPAETEDRTG